MGVHGGDDIVGAVGTSPVHCNLDWQRGWQRNEVVVHQWVYHCYDDDAVIFFFQSYIIVLKGNPKLHITTIRRVGGRQEQELINPGHIKYNYESQKSPVSPHTFKVTAQLAEISQPMSDLLPTTTLKYRI
jgi:hypothetical protein